MTATVPVLPSYLQDLWAEDLGPGPQSINVRGIGVAVGMEIGVIGLDPTWEKGGFRPPAGCLCKVKRIWEQYHPDHGPDCFCKPQTYCELLMPVQILGGYYEGAFRIQSIVYSEADLQKYFRPVLQ